MLSLVAIKETSSKAAVALFLSATAALICVGWYTSPAIAQTPGELHDDFEAGIDPTVWNVETVGGSTWYPASEGGNGYIYSPGQTSYNNRNQNVDILTWEDGFSDFIATWDMRFHTGGIHHDLRFMYFRSDDYLPRVNGYWVFIGVDRPSPLPPNHVDLEKRGVGTRETLATLNYLWATEQWYCFKLKVFGNQFRLKVWERGAAEPADWTLEAVDAEATYSSGRIGFGNYRYGVTDVDNVHLVPAIQATVDVDPNTLNLKSEGNYATTYIELPEGCDPADIDVSTVTFEDVLPAMPSPTSIGDYDGDTIPDLMVKFNRDGIISLLSDSDGSSLWVRDLRSDIAPLNHGDEYEVTVSGQLADGRMFIGADVIRVINPGSGSDDATVLNVCPSPLKATATISYEVRQEGHVSLRVYDAAGRLVCTLVSGHRAAGRHEITWDRKADDDQPVATGVYFLRLEQRGQAWVKKALVVK